MKKTDVIIVGGGLMGTATALFLRRMGASVVLFEQDRVGQYASGTNFGAVRRIGRPIHQLELANRSRRLWGALPELAGSDCEFIASGQLVIAESRAKADEWEAYARDAAQAGLTLEMISGNALKARFPNIGNFPAGLFSPEDGHANPRLVAPALARAANAQGAILCEGARVAAITKNSEDFIVSVDGRGEFCAPVVVVAAGAWGARISATFGEGVPLIAAGPQMAVTEPVPYRLRELISLSTEAFADMIYYRQVERGNIIFGGGLRVPVALDERRAIIDPDHTLSQLARVSKLVPAIGRLNVIRSWSGVEGYLPDELPVFGRSSRVSGLYYTFGFSGSGFQIGLAVGETLAKAILHGNNDSEFGEYSISRFEAAGDQFA